jgi:hypothetical protein
MWNRLRWAVTLLALVSAWVPWLGICLSLIALTVPGGARPAIGRALAWVSIVLGICGTTAFYALPKGSVAPGDPALDLLEERLQPVGNLEEKKSPP